MKKFFLVLAVFIFSLFIFQTAKAAVCVCDVDSVSVCVDIGGSINIIGIPVEIKNESDCSNIGICSLKKDFFNCGFYERGEQSSSLSKDETKINALLAGVNGIENLNQLGNRKIPEILGEAIRVLMGLMGSIAFVMFIYGGVMWMTAAGNAERAGKAVKIMLWAALGVAVILASYALVDFVFEAVRTT